MIGFSHWGMFELSEEECVAIAITVIAGDAGLWKSDDSGWLEPDCYSEAEEIA